MKKFAILGILGILISSCGGSTQSEEVPTVDTVVVSESETTVFDTSAVDTALVDTASSM